MRKTTVRVNGKDWDIPHWVVLESKNSLLLLEEVPYWAFRNEYGMSYAAFLREKQTQDREQYGTGPENLQLGQTARLAV